MPLPILLALPCALLAAAGFTPLPLPDWLPPIALCALLAALLLAFLGRKAGPGRQSRRPAGREIAVDGSNLLYWRGDKPELATVAHVLRRLEEQGRRPKVWFDANVGYLVANRYLNAGELAQMLKIDRADVVVASKGEPADPLILTAALRRDIPVLSNDRYRDWQEAFPAIAEPGRVLQGRFVNGVLRLDPALAPTQQTPKPKTSPLSVPGERRRAAPTRTRTGTGTGTASQRREPRL